MRVLLIDTDKPTRIRLNHCFTKDQLLLDVEADPATAMEFEKIRQYDGVIFGLPELDQAIQFFQPKLRRPVLVLSEDQTVEQKVKMLQAGADDYVTRPFFVDEILARMRAMIRRYNGHTFSILQVGTVQLNLDNQQVKVGDQIVHFFPTEYKMLECLMLRQGRTVTKEALFDYMYGGMNEPEVKIFDVMLSRIRKKTRSAGDFIETVWGRGWRIAEPAAGRQV